MLNSRGNRQTVNGRGQSEWSAAVYRRMASPSDLVKFGIRVKQTDMLISAQSNLQPLALALVLEARAQVESRIENQPEFLTSLVPLPPDCNATPVVAAMLEASRRANVGPMAAVAGAIAEYVGRGLENESPEIIVENGGDIFLRSRNKREVALVGESSPLMGIRIAIPPVPEGAGIATSAGTLGHSLSFGRADAVMVFADSGQLADSIATAIGNVVKSAGDLQMALDEAKKFGARGTAILADGHLAIWGEIELIG